jgi:hypothetical protein
MPLKLTPDELAALESAMRHPRPWSISDTDNFIRDANGEPVADIGGNSARADATGRFIVTVINEYAARDWWDALPNHLKRKYNREGASVLELYREWVAR